MNVYERAFHEETREKKRIGSNIFSRKASRKGSTGPLKTPYAYMTNAQRKKLHGKVVTYNMRDILPLAEFEALPKERQRELLILWRNHHSNKEIIRTMGFSSSMKFYDLINELDIPKKDTANNREKLTDIPPEEVEKLKKELISYEEFKKLPKDVRLDIFHAYNQEYNTKELCELWGVAGNTIHQLRHEVKKKLAAATQEKENIEKLKKESDPNTPGPQTNLVLIENKIDKQQEAAEKVEKTEQIAFREEENFTMPEETKPVETIELPVPQEKKGMSFNFSDEGNAADLVHQLKTIADIFKNKNKVYKFTIEIEEAGESVLQQEIAASVPEIQEVEEETPEITMNGKKVTDQQLEIVTEMLLRMVGNK